MTGKWSPWIDHDGGLCPVPIGSVVWVDVAPHAVVERGRYCVFKVGPRGRTWCGWPFVARYRVLRLCSRTSAPMAVLRQIAAGTRVPDGREGPGRRAEAGE